MGAANKTAFAIVGSRADFLCTVVHPAGFVASQWQIDKAVQVASAVNCIKRVKNNLIHKPN